MEKKQTAVEQLIHEMKSLLEQPYVNPKNALNDCINLAYNKIQMEKEQMKDVYLSHCVKAERLRKIFEQQFDDYYNETYGETKN
jgi:hypothetical protein